MRFTPTCGIEGFRNRCSGNRSTSGLRFCSFGYNGPHSKAKRALVLAAIIVAIGVGSSLGLGADERGRRSTIFDGETLTGWREPRGDWQMAQSVRPGESNPQVFVIAKGEGILVNGQRGRTSNLLSQLEHADVKAHIEFCVPKGSNSGVYFMGRYEIQVLDSWEVEQPKYSDCGGIYERWKDNQGYEGHAPRVNASKPPGEWQTFDVVFRAPRFDDNGKKIENARFVKVVHNGIVVHENVDVTGPTRAATYENVAETSQGPLMLQGDHGPVAYRNIWLDRIRLD